MAHPTIPDATRLRSPLRCYPVTVFCTAIAVALFLAVEDFNRRHPDHSRGGHSAWGAASQLMIKAEPELNGLFELWGDRWWSGEWWRITVSGFHHADVFHLLVNGVFLVYLGRLAEPRVGRLKFLLVFVTATTVSLIPTFLMGRAVIGLSGGIYAVLGLLIVMRPADEDLQRLLPGSLIGIALLLIPIGFLLGDLGLSRASNLSHLTGLIYGWTAGRSLFPVPARWRILTGRRFLAGQVLLVPAVIAATFPVWNARFHWYRSTQTADPEEQVALLHETVKWNPRLAAAWRHLARRYRERGDSQKQWEAILEGLKNNPSDQEMIQLAYEWWESSPPQHQRIALRVLQRTFPETSRHWHRNLRFFTRPAVPPFRRVTRRDWIFARWGPPIPPFFELYWPPVDGEQFATPQPLHAPAVDPGRPDSAALGRRM